MAAARRAALAALLGLAAACSRPAPPAAETAVAGWAGAADFCALFTTRQIADALGKPVNGGRANPGMGADGCQWDAMDARGTVLIQVLPAAMWADLAPGAGHRLVTGIGEKAYLAPSPLGGVQGGAVHGDSLYFVRLDPAPADGVALGLLRNFVGRAAP